MSRFLWFSHVRNIRKSWFPPKTVCNVQHWEISPSGYVAVRLTRSLFKARDSKRQSKDEKSKNTERQGNNPQMVSMASMMGIFLARFILL